jgi:thymidylate kinase
VFYDVGNYLAGHEMARLAGGGTPVVLDRHWASTQSYILGQAGGGDAPLPPPGDAAYAWPSDLPRADHMLLLTLPEEERLARRAGRTAVGETDEEAAFRRRAALGQRINECYRRFGCVEVSASGPPEAVTDRVLAAVGLAGGSKAGATAAATTA